MSSPPKTSLVLTVLDDYPSCFPFQLFYFVLDCLWPYGLLHGVSTLDFYIRIVNKYLYCSLETPPAFAFQKINNFSLSGLHAVEQSEETFLS